MNLNQDSYKSLSIETGKAQPEYRITQYLNAGKYQLIVTAPFERQIALVPLNPPVGFEFLPGVVMGVVALGQADPLVTPKHPVREIRCTVVVDKGSTAEATFVPVAGPNAIGMMTPMNKVLA